MDQTAIVITNSQWGETSDTPCLVQHRAHVDSIFRHTTCMLWVYEMRISNYMLMFHYLYNHSIYVSINWFILMIGITPPYSSGIQ